MPSHSAAELGWVTCPFDASVRRLGVFMQPSRCCVVRFCHLAGEWWGSTVRGWERSLVAHRPAWRGRGLGEGTDGRIAAEGRNPSEHLGTQLCCAVWLVLAH